MNRLSLVGTWLGLPSHSRNRFSKTLMRSMNGTLKCSPGPNDRVADRLAEPGDDHLLGLTYRGRQFG